MRGRVNAVNWAVAKNFQKTRRNRRHDAIRLPQRGTIGGEGDAAGSRGGPEMHPVGAAVRPGRLPPAGSETAPWVEFWMQMEASSRRVRQSHH